MTQGRCALGVIAVLLGTAACYRDRTAPSKAMVRDATLAPWSTSTALEAYIKASNTAPGGGFATSVALSADGSTLAVGAGFEAGASTGIGGDQTVTSAFGTGAVYVFARSGATWHQQAYIKGSNTESGDMFGYRLALSADGSTLAVGAYNEGSAATGVGGNQTDNSAASSGAVYVFTRAGGTWSQQAYVKASNTDAGDMFGGDVALSADGNTLAVGASSEDSANDDQTDNSASGSGAIYVFVRTGATWRQQAYLKAPNAGVGDAFGHVVLLSADGGTLAVGAVLEDSAATGVGGNQSDDSASDSGAVYVFAHAGATWSHQAYVKASNTAAADRFGQSLALSRDGNTLAVVAYDEASAATGIGGNQSDNSAPGSGAVYVFVRTGATWRQQAYTKASNTEADDHFGSSIALSADGSTLAVGAESESSAASGVGGNQRDNSAEKSGAVYVLARTGASWSQQAYVKASNTEADDHFGSSIALSADGSTLAVSAVNEGSAATGIDGNQFDNSAQASGAVYVLTVARR